MRIKFAGEQLSASPIAVCVCVRSLSLVRTIPKRQFPHHICIICNILPIISIGIDSDSAQTELADGLCHSGLQPGEVRGSVGPVGCGTVFDIQPQSGGRSKHTAERAEGGE